jgi:hypothetical protein
MGKKKVDKTTLSLIKPSVVSMVVTHAERKTERPVFITFHAANSCKVQIINIFGGKESIDRRKVWEKVLLLKKPARRHMRVIGKHFLREDFINPFPKNCN